MSPEFGVVRLYRTFSLYLVTGETRSAGCLCNSSGWFKHSEPHRTYSNHNITELARCGEVCHMSSGWFDCTEPSLATAVQGKQGVQGAYALVRGGSSTSNLIEPHRTYSNHNITKLARFCISTLHCNKVHREGSVQSNHPDFKRSGWFDCTEPSLSTAV